MLRALGIAFRAAGALWGRATRFFYHFSVHLSSVLGRTELCHGEKPPKIREKKSSQEQSSWELFRPPPTEKTEKIGKIKGTLVRKVPGNLRSQEFVFFVLVRFFFPLRALS